MKLRNIILTGILCLGLPLAGWAQDVKMAGHQHISKTPQYRAGEVLVKFKADGRLKVRRKANGQISTSGVTAVDNVLKQLNIKEADALMPLTGHIVSPKKMRAYNGKTITDTDLSQLYCLKSSDKKTPVTELVEQLNALDEVEYAEPNYLVYALDAVEAPNDPMMSELSNLDAVNVKPLWGMKPLTKKRPVIAIIDTGVDITHPDLVDNIWTNPLEAEGEEKADDDGNGFKDDIHGWDFVNQTGRIGDWNGHGTHCAGIAAAVGNNGIGIVGANPDALIMPITVLQSSGSGDVAAIIKGVDYAAANGADVLSMSIGGYGVSVAEEQALAKAYSKCVIVAAAGNDCYTLGPKNCPYCRESPQALFPAAFTFVLGVQASDAIGWFSNTDLQDGPVLSSYDEEKLYNYELQAPGAFILSTYPGGRYVSMCGTSMACPLVAGAVSRLLQTKEYLSNEILFGDLIHTSNGNINALAAYNLSDEDRHPTLDLVSFRIDDSEGDGDGRPDAGETIKIYPTIRNQWGQAHNIKLSLGIGGVDDASLVDFITPHVDMGLELSSYAKSESQNPFVIKLSDEIVDGRHLYLAVTATCDNCDPDYKPQEFMLNIENGVELGGTQRENITLYPGVSYIVSRNWGIPRDVTVTVKAGTVIKIKDDVGISNYGHMIFEGTQDSMIVITKGDNDYGVVRNILNDNANYVTFNYVKFDNLRGYIHFDGHTYNNCIISNCGCGVYLTQGATFRGCNFYNNDIAGTTYAYFSIGSSFTECNIHRNTIACTEPYDWKNCGWGSSTRFYRSNYIDNEIISYPDYYFISSFGPKDLDESNLFGNRYSLFPNKNFSFLYNTTEPEIAYLNPCFLGTGNKEIAKETILDTEDNVGWGTVDVWQMYDQAVATAPGCVSYITVDGYDPLDEGDMMPPLGVGKHTIKVYFNRQMNTDVKPSVFMGVRPPYTQKNIGENGRWETKRIYTAEFNLDGKSATDGLNRIHVFDYQQKENDWQLPEERLRYNVQVQVAGSMSTGAMATPGLGKVTLTWETRDEEFADLMGFNLYRYTMLNDSVAGDTVVVNSSLIEPGEVDEYKVMRQEFVDYNVVPGTTYYYYIKELGTDLMQNEISNVVAATPLTAQKGDSNGSMDVDVADILTDISYIMGENPQPFIFDAADVNEDKSVNIIDVIATVDLIMDPAAESKATIESIATFSVEDGILYVDSPVELGGVQVVFYNKDGNFKAMDALNGLEKLSCKKGNGDWMFLSFSMTGETIPAGRQALLDLQGGQVAQMILSDTHGHNVTVLNDDATSIRCLEELDDTDASTTTRIFDISGREVKRSNMTSGIYIVSTYKDGKKVKSYKMMNK